MKFVNPFVTLHLINYVVRFFSVIHVISTLTYLDLPPWCYCNLFLSQVKYIYIALFIIYWYASKQLHSINQNIITMFVS